jgi:transcription elongation factor GreA
MAEKNYLTKEKFKELQEELHNLETVKRKEIAEKLEYARSLGDLSENAEYHDARNSQAETESRINYLTELLKNVEIVKPHHADSVEVGSTVTIKKKGTQDKNTYQLVSSEEADLALNKISYESPLGQAMMGKTKKEEFSFETPKGTVDYVVVDID